MSFVSQQTDFLSLWFCFVAGLISPWNLPLYLLTWKIAPAIACGNTVVAKPSEMTSVTAWMMCKLLEKAGESYSMLRSRKEWKCLSVHQVFLVAEIRRCSKALGKTAVAECCTGEQKGSNYSVCPVQLLLIFCYYLLVKSFAPPALHLWIP